MKRRDFIASTIATGSALSMYPYVSNASPVKSQFLQTQDEFLEDDSIMILIDLFGGNDG